MAKFDRQQSAALARETRRVLRPIARRDVPALQLYPEVAIAAGGLAFAYDENLDQPVIVERDETVVLGGASLVPSIAAAVVIRHAAEIAIFRASAAAQVDVSYRAAAALLAGRSTAVYLRGLAAPDRSAAAKGLPSDLQHAYQTLSTEGHWPDLRALLGTDPAVMRALLSLEVDGLDVLQELRRSPAAQAEAFNLSARLQHVAAPVEALLARGGDPRIAIEPASGRNGYGASGRPVLNEIVFSSSTASTISEPAYRAAEGLRRRLLWSAVRGEMADAFAGEMASLRDRLADFLGLANSESIVLTASGTDSELVAQALALATRPEPMVSVLIAPDETGSGIPRAAAGTHFLGLTALGETVVPGAALHGWNPNARGVRGIAVRNLVGRCRSLDEVDAEVEAEVEAVVAGGGRVLLHVIDSAKTGVGAPSIACLNRLARRHGPMVEVLVDACQMRLSTEAIRGYLAAGAMVQITGSKFYGGPPFSGALLLPAGMSRLAASGVALPGGLADYSSRHDWPTALAATFDNLKPALNLGLALRWTAALSEMAVLAGVSASEAIAALARFEETATGILSHTPGITLVDSRPLDRGGLGAKDAWANLRTILPFTMQRMLASGQMRGLSPEDAKLVHRWLQLDLSTPLHRITGKDDVSVLATSCLLGQPVKLASATGSLGALRLCSSGRIARRALAGEAAALTADVETVARKLRLILTHFDVLAAALASG